MMPLKQKDELKDGFTSTPDWFTRDLKVKGLEKEILSIVYRFSAKDGMFFYGSIEYIMNITGGGRTTTINVLKKLVNKKLISKYSNGFGNPNKYKVNIPLITKLHNSSISELFNNCTINSSTSELQKFKSCTINSSTSEPNNIIYNRINNREILEEEKNPKPSPLKNRINKELAERKADEKIFNGAEIDWTNAMQVQEHISKYYKANPKEFLKIKNTYYPDCDNETMRSVAIAVSGDFARNNPRGCNMSTKKGINNVGNRFIVFLTNQKKWDKENNKNKPSASTPYPYSNKL